MKQIVAALIIGAAILGAVTLYNQSQERVAATQAQSSAYAVQQKASTSFGDAILGK